MSKVLILVLLVAIACCQPTIAFNDPQFDLTKRITSCWLMTINEISKAQDQMNEVMNFTKTIGFSNRTQVYYKVQTDMIGRCYENINLTHANDVLLSLSDPTLLSSSRFTEVVSDFKFSDYVNDLLDFNLEESDLALLKIVKQLEGELHTYKDNKDVKLQQQKKEKDEKRHQAIKVWQEALIKNSKGKVEEVVVPSIQPSTVQYIFFAVLMSLLLCGAIFGILCYPIHIIIKVVKVLSKVDQSSKKLKKQQKKEKKL